MAPCNRREGANLTPPTAPPFSLKWPVLAEIGMDRGARGRFLKLLSTLMRLDTWPSASGRLNGCTGDQKGWVSDAKYRKACLCLPRMAVSPWNVHGWGSGGARFKASEPYDAGGSLGAIPQPPGWVHGTRQR